MNTVNTRIITQDFDYLVPETIEQALDLLERHAPRCRIIAGGTDLLVQLKDEKISTELLINILKIPGLKGIHEEDGLRIGAATKLYKLREFCSSDPRYLSLFEAITSLGKPQVWHMGTIGGNLCNASPAADTAPPLLALDAIVTLTGKGRVRTMGLLKFFKGVGVTALAPSELLSEVRIPSPPANLGSSFLKISRVGADISKITCAVAVERDGDRCGLCRIALGAVAPTPLRALEAERLLQGRRVAPSLVEEAGREIARITRPIDDIRSSADYRREVSQVLFGDAFHKAWHRASGELR